MVPENTGEMIQLATISSTWPHITESAEIPTTAKPTIAPMMEWVVDTGQPYFEATTNHIPAANRDESIPKISNSGLSSKPALSISIMLLLIVEVTSPPASQAPVNSKTIAIIMACLIVIARAPTEVPIAFATSFAPTPHAIKKPKKQAIINSKKPYWEITSDII